MMRKFFQRAQLRYCAALIAGLCYSASVSAHEFWMLPQPSAVAVGDTTRLSLNVGENFTGEVVPFSRQYVTVLDQYTADGKVDLLKRVAGSADVSDFPIRLETPGTHLFVYEGHPNRIVLSAEKFNAYLRLEGLEYIVRSREAAGTVSKPAREQYRRYVKTLVEAGGKSDATYAMQTRQRFEILPLSDLPAARPNDPLSMTVLYEQKPLANALVKAWHVRGNQQLVIQTRTDDAGKFTFTLPYAGTWMVSVVHMVPALDPAKDDWESLWGNLTFVLKPASCAMKNLLP